MNKNELIEKYKELEKGSFDIGALVVCQSILKDLKQLDEPQKVKVPQFVAEYIEWAKEEDFHLLGAMNKIATSGRKNLYEWFWDYDDNMDIFARAWLDGYEVDKKKRHRVKMKGMSEENTYLTFRFGHTWMLSNFEECEEFRLHHTRKELEDAGFGWVFDCPGIEIEEVAE